jgi:DivIVA domain-containing protein
MGTVLLVLVVVLVVAALVFGVVSLLSGDDPGLGSAEPDGRAVPLPNNRSLTEGDLKAVRFDVSWRGYRMAQVDRVLRRTAYDVGYKDEMIAVLEAEVIALREGRTEDAELFRKARESAANPSVPAANATELVVEDGGEVTGDDEDVDDDEPGPADHPDPTENDSRATSDEDSASPRPAAETTADETGAPAADRA